MDCAAIHLRNLSVAAAECCKEAVLHRESVAEAVEVGAAFETGRHA